MVAIGASIEEKRFFRKFRQRPFSAGNFPCVACAVCTKNTVDNVGTERPPRSNSVMNSEDISSSSDGGNSLPNL